MHSERELWERCAAFHGHVCPGLMIGFKATLYAMRLLDLVFSEDEEVVCVSENDACGVDAIQVALGCSVGKGNLLFHMTGKMAFSFYSRKSGRSTRLMLRPGPEGESRDEAFARMQDADPEALFDVMPTRIALPERARHFGNIDCEVCGERTAERYIRLQGGKKVCIDCFKPYNRFQV